MYNIRKDGDDAVFEINGMDYLRSRNHAMVIQIALIVAAIGNV